MAPSKVIALLLAFALVIAATLHSSEARVQGFKPAAADQESSEASAVAGEAAQQPPASPGFPGFPLPQIPGFSFPIPQIPGFPIPQIPNFPIPQIPGFQFPPIPGFPPMPNIPFPVIPRSPPSHPSPSSPPASPAPPPPKECTTSLMSLMPCVDFLTNITVLTPPSECCSGFKSVVSTAPICLCHARNGDLNSRLPKPIDPIRMFFLPTACHTSLPIQTLFMCATQPVPPLMPPSSPAAPANSRPVSSPPYV